MSRREVLTRLTQPDESHAGLWLDKFTRSIRGDDTDAKRTLVEEAVRVREPLDYKAFFERYEAALKSCEARPAQARCDGRLIIGLGNEAVLETSISLHRTYGVPLIPGSALKGLASSFAHRWLEGDGWRKAKDKTPPGAWHQELFGDTSISGVVTFFDALYVPGSGHNGQALWADVLTVHHQDYYNKFDPNNPEKQRPPADWDSPVPVPLISATGSFLIALAGPENWVSLAYDILEQALKLEGIGAKTSSGYGRLTLENPLRAEQKKAEAEKLKMSARATEALADIKMRASQAWMQFAAVPKKVGPLAQELIALEIGETEKREAAATILARIKSHPEAKTLKKQAWYARLAALAGEP